MAKPYGHTAKIERRDRHGQMEVMEIRRIGPLCNVERAARLTSGFQRIISTEAVLTQHGWEQAYGVRRLTL